VGDAIVLAYRWGDGAPSWWPLLRWPLGLLLTWASYTVLLSWAPRRRQPNYPWLAAGGAIAIVLWLAVTALLALYVAKTDTFRSTYGPLTSVLALLIWANLTAVALLFGVAFCAQIEAVRAGAPAPTSRITCLGAAAAVTAASVALSAPASAAPRNEGAACVQAGLGTLKAWGCTRRPPSAASTTRRWPTRSPGRSSPICPWGRTCPWARS
jgi:hypothetical protein